MNRRLFFKQTALALGAISIAPLALAKSQNANLLDPKETVQPKNAEHIVFYNDVTREPEYEIFRYNDKLEFNTFNYYPVTTENIYTNHPFSYMRKDDIFREYGKDYWSTIEGFGHISGLNGNPVEFVELRPLS